MDDDNGWTVDFRDGDGEDANRIINLIQDFNANELTEFGGIVKREVFIPMKLSLFSVLAFWSMFAHGSLKIYELMAAGILIFAICSVKDIRRSPASVKMIDIRLCQLTCMHIHMMFVSLFCTLLARFNYFRMSNNLESLSKQISDFLSISIYEIRWGIFLAISNQVYWLSLNCILIVRLITNLVWMSRTPSFRVLLKYETQAFVSTTLAIFSGVAAFNYLADTYGDSELIAVVLISSLATWVVICLVKSMLYTEEIQISRTNNIDGALKMLTVTICQVVWSGLLFTSLSVFMEDVLGLPRSFDRLSTLDKNNNYVTPNEGIRKYFEAVQNKMFKTGTQQQIIKFNSTIIINVIWIVDLVRTLKHFYYTKKLERIMDQMEHH